MAKALRIKGTDTLVRFDERYASQDRFEVVEVADGKIVTPKKATAKKKVAKKKAAKKKAKVVEPAIPMDDPLDDLITGLDDDEHG